MTATKRYIATEPTQQEIRNYVEAIKNAVVAGGGGSGVTPHITVFAPTGSTVTASKGPAVLTAEESNGVWQFNVPSLGDWVISCTKDGRTGKRTVSVDEVREYKVRVAHGYRYGFRIRESEGNCAARVEYLFDAVGMTPAHMNFSTGIFDYGDWGDKWFVAENKPCMLKRDGTVDYYLDPNNYDLKEDGTASDVSNTGYDGNAMSEIPKVWVKRYTDGEWRYTIFSDVQYDDEYSQDAYIRADGTAGEHFCWSMFGGSGGAAMIRSLSGQTRTGSLTAQQEVDGAKANGSLWYTHTWSRHELIKDLLILMGKSTNTQAVFGMGNCRSATSASGILPTGTLKNMGQFFGYNDATHQVKVFHIEAFWGDMWDRTAGCMNDHGTIWVKMNPTGQGYRVTDTVGYTNTGITVPNTAGNNPNYGYINGVNCSKYGTIPVTITGSDSTFYADAFWANNGQLDYLLVGACANIAAGLGGACAFSVYVAPVDAYWFIGCGLSCDEPAAA